MPAPAPSAEALALALEVVRRAWVSDDAFHRLSNAARPGVPSWAVVLAGGSPAAAPGAASAPGPSPATAGGGDDGTSAVPVFERPTPVVVVGPNPLPVTMEGGGPAAREPKGPPQTGEQARGPGVIGRTISQVVGKMGMILGPLGTLANVLQAGNSGVDTFSKSVKLMGATMAPLVLPGFVLLSAALVATSDVLFSDLLPQLSEFYRLIMAAGVPALRRFVESLQAAARVSAAMKGQESASGKASFGDYFDKLSPFKVDIPLVGTLGDMLEGAVKKGIDHGNAVREKFGLRPADETKDWVNKWMLGGRGWQGEDGKPSPAAREEERRRRDEYFAGDSAKQAEIRDAFPRQVEAWRAGRLLSEGKAPADPTKLVGQSMDKVIESIARSIGPSASYDSLTSIKKTVELTGLNGDPIEAQQLRVMQETLREFQKWRNESKGQPEPAVRPREG